MNDRPELDAADPLALFQTWLSEAEKTEPNDPNAAALATATPDGAPSVRMVLVKNVDCPGFCFFTNAGSQKGCELTANPRAALCFHWKSLRRQIRAAGKVVSLSDEAVDKYFHSRSRKSQIGAAVSQQSRPLASRDVLEQQVAEFSAKHPDGEIPRPAFWRGYSLDPDHIEFWIDGPDRLHDRVVFDRSGDSWTRTRLYP